MASAFQSSFFLSNFSPTPRSTASMKPPTMKAGALSYPSTTTLATSSSSTLPSGDSMTALNSYVPGELNCNCVVYNVFPPMLLESNSSLLSFVTVNFVTDSFSNDLTVMTPGLPSERSDAFSEIVRGLKSMPTRFEDSLSPALAYTRNSPDNVSGTVIVNVSLSSDPPSTETSLAHAPNECSVASCDSCCTGPAINKASASTSTVIASAGMSTKVTLNSSPFSTLAGANISIPIPPAVTGFVDMAALTTGCGVSLTVSFFATIDGVPPPEAPPPPVDWAPVCWADGWGAAVTMVVLVV